MDIHAIYQRQYARVYRIGMLYMKNTSDAEDVVQSVFVKYIEKPVQFRDLEHEGYSEAFEAQYQHDSNTDGKCKK